MKTGKEKIVGLLVALSLRRARQAPNGVAGRS
jgi:hypothetical protein